MTERPGQPGLFSFRHAIHLPTYFRASSVARGLLPEVLVARRNEAVKFQKQLRSAFRPVSSEAGPGEAGRCTLQSTKWSLTGNRGRIPAPLNGGNRLSWLPCSGAAVLCAHEILLGSGGFCGAQSLGFKRTMDGSRRPVGCRICVNALAITMGYRYRYAPGHLSAAAEQVSHDTKSLSPRHCVLLDLRGISGPTRGFSHRLP